VQPGTTTCVFCGGDIAALAREYARNQRDIEEAAGRLRAMLAAKKAALHGQQAGGPA
jgi:hypothetical protein